MCGKKLKAHSHALKQSGSTFGYVAHARRALNPYMITLDKKRTAGEWQDREWEAPQCIREHTSEPCFHMWPMMIAQVIRSYLNTHANQHFSK
jgi:hypothetical protein